MFKVFYGLRILCGTAGRQLSKGGPGHAEYKFWLSTSELGCFLSAVSWLDSTSRFHAG